MKALLRDWVLKTLQFLAKRKLRKIQPTIVGITGSAGKTSAKEVIYEVLSRRFETKKSEKNLNSQFGTVLTILDLKSGYSSAMAWGGVLFQALVDTFKKPAKYEILVLEMGIDCPGFSRNFRTSCSMV